MHARDLIAEVLRTSVSIPAGDILLAHLDGWDSLKGVRLVLRLEEIVGRELSEDDIEKLQSVEGSNDFGSLRAMK
jgi:acyl carrier protein